MVRIVDVRAAFRGGLGHAAIIGILLFGELGPLTPPARAAGNNNQPAGATDPIPTDGPARAVPFYAAGDTNGISADPSISLRKHTKAERPPATRTPKKEHWTANQRVYANPDGTMTVELGRSINFNDASGAWQATDLALVDRGNGRIGPRSAPGATMFHTTSGDALVASLTGLDGMLKLRALGYGPGGRSGDHLVYKGTNGAADVFVMPTDLGFEFGATLADASISPVMSFVLDSGALTVVLAEDQRSLDIRTAAGESIGFVSAPVVYDGNGVEAPASTTETKLVARGDGSYLLTYSIDARWLHAKDRGFPVTLDPSACIRSGGGTSCTINGSGSNTEDVWFGNGAGHADDFVNPTTTNYDHVGNDKSTGNAWGFTRAVYFFDPVTFSLDGSVITNATLTLAQFYNYSGVAGSSGADIYARLLNKAWTTGSTAASWNNLASAVDSAFDSPIVHPCGTAGADCDVVLDVSKIVRAWYTNTRADWKWNPGIQVRNEECGTSTCWETSFYRQLASTGLKPLLTITYEVGGFELDFDPRLGPTYAPSSMVSGTSTVLPITIKNTSALTYDTTNYRAGYRFFDMKGATVASGVGNLPANIGAGGTSALFGLTVTPPSTPGQYTMRLDVVKVVNGNNVYFSDWGVPSKFYSRDKKVLTSDSTRWTGSSVMERNDFGVTVTNGQGAGSAAKSVDLGADGSLSIDLYSKNLRYLNDTGLGFSDALPVGLTYGYNSKDAASCTGYKGILGACGWFTNWDERIVAGGTDGAYTYYDPQGNAYLTDSGSSGQLLGAPVQVSRVRATLFDENRPTSGGALVLASGEGITDYSGPNVIEVASATANTTLAGFLDGAATRQISLNTYRQLSFAIRTTSANHVALGLEVEDKSNGKTAWYYVEPNGNWLTSGNRFYWSSSPVGTWRSFTLDLWGAASGTTSPYAALGKVTDAYFLKTIKVMGEAGQTGSTYIDRVELAPYSPATLYSGASWTLGSSTTTYWENAHYEAAQISAPVRCDAACFTARIKTETYMSVGYSAMQTQASAPFVSWWWKKAGGTSAAMTFCVTDVRTGVKGQLTYYAGAQPPSTMTGCTGTTVSGKIRISPNAPSTSRRVIRNVADDARQALGFFKDSDMGTTTASAPDQGPSPDDVLVTGFAIDPVDGQHLLFSEIYFNSASDPGDGLTRYFDGDSFGQDNLNNAPTRDDFQAEYPDGSIHFFNRDGLLTRIRSVEGAEIAVEWQYAASGTGPTAYTLKEIHGPSDNTVNGSYTYQHAIAVTKTNPSGFDQWTFTEKLNNAANAAVDGRRVDFFVATAAGTNYGNDDLVKVSPARHNSATCGAQSGSGNGCLEYAYTATTGHLLAMVEDPRWNGATSGSDDARFEVTWSGGSPNNPMAVKDRSHASAALVNVITFDRGRTGPTAGNSPYALRPLWQDAAAIASAYAIHEDLSPDGNGARAYVRQGPCTASDCSTNQPTGTDAALTPLLASSNYYDGIANVTRNTEYRCPGASVAGLGCPGSTALLVVTRQGTNAAAKVDNYSDPLAARQVAWTQSSDQYFASLRDSGGTNEDLYRTEYVYNGVNKPLAVTTPTFNRSTSFEATVLAAEGLTNYWRLNEASGNLTDLKGGAVTTASNLTYAQAGGLIGDASNKAISFNGSTSKATASVNIDANHYTIEAWVKLPDTDWSDMRIAGKWSANLGAQLFVDSNGTFAFRHNATTVTAASANVYPQDGRWYFVAGTWDGSTAKLYIDGALVAMASVTGTTGQPATTFNIGAETSTGYLFGLVDEVALSTVAWDQSVIRAHMAAATATAPNRVETQYGFSATGWDIHQDTLPTQLAGQLVENGGFESGLVGWNTRHGAAIVNWDTNPTNLPDVGLAGNYNDFDALVITNTNWTDQLVQALPGQRVHFQVSVRTTGSASARASFRVDYLRTSDHTWQPFVAQVNASDTVSADYAYEYTVPLDDTTGLLKVTFSNSGGTGTALFNDVMLLTTWQRWTYVASPNYAPAGSTRKAYIRDGQISHIETLAPNGQIRSDHYTQDATGAHQALWTTEVVSNYVDGTQGPDPFEDVTTSSTFDSWGRVTASSDPDGVTTQSVYGTNLTDVAQRIDGLGNATSMTYDAVGNLLSQTTPLGRATVNTYDYRDNLLTSSAPDGVVARTDYDNYGRPAATWANYVNGVVESGDNDLTDDLLSVSLYDPWGRVKQQDADCGSVATCATGGLDARSTTTYDLLGNVVTTTTYPGAGGTGTARVTTNHFETYGSGPVYSRSSASGIQLPIGVTDSSLPFCPGSTTVRCNSSAMWQVNGTWRSAVDLNGRAFATTDGYGITMVVDGDLAGKPVQTIANFVAGAGSTSDQNVTTRMEYNVAGDPIASKDAAGRRVVRLYDVLGHVLQVSHQDTNSVEFLLESTEHTPAGRVSSSFDGSSWTTTQYDLGGRAIRTIAHDDPTGSTPRMVLDGFEAGTTAWHSTSSGFFTTSIAANLSTNIDGAGNSYGTVAPVSGQGRLHITTHATNTNDGAWWDISGPTYVAGHTYKASFDLVGSQAGLVMTAYLGQDASGGSYGSLPVTTTTSWARSTVSWTATANITSPIRFAIKKASAGTTELYVDNLVIWDSTPGFVDQGIVSSFTAYNADGEIIATVLPPGDPATERPLVTSSGFDRAGRTVVTTVNGASGAYASNVLGTPSIAAYVPLDERFGAPYADKKSGATALTVSGAAPVPGIAGGIDEARTALAFTGGYLTRATNATSATTNVSMEAWIRSEFTPDGATHIVASNGTATDSWGLAIDGTGKASGFTQKSSNPSAGFNTLVSDTVVTDGRWHHLVLTRGASTWAMTLDGVAKTLTNNTKDPGTPGAGFTIGAWSDGTRAFTGEIDEVSVYSGDISGSTTAAHWAAGRIADTVTGLTSRTAFDRLGRTTDTWAADLVRTRAGYDRLGRQVETIANYRDGITTGGTADDDVRSTYAYDVLGELVGYCPAEEVKVGGCDPSDINEVQAWRYVFDALGRQTKTIPPDNTAVTDLTTEELVYEPGGRVAQTCRYAAGSACGSTNGRHIDFSYDDLGRITTQATWDRGAGSDTLKFTKTRTWHPDGSPATVNEGSDTLTYLYDTAGRLSQFKRGTTVLTAFTYTAGTNTIASRTDGTQGTSAFTYDWARRQTVIDPPDTYVAGTVTRSYRVDGLLSTQSFPASLTETLAYDAAKRPTSISLGSAGSMSQTYDRAGSVTSDGRSLTGITGDAGTNTQAFSYDALHRLTGSSGLAAGTSSYQYDLDGNRTRRVEGGVTTDYQYDRADQLQQQTIGGTTKTFAYDAFGNLTQSADAASAYTNYGYDEASRLTSITPPTGGAIAMTMDALDRPATRSVGGSTADTYGYLGASETAWLTGQGTTTGALLDAAGSRLAVKTGSSVSWVVFDLHGSVAGMCAAGTSALADAYRYDGWGRQVAKSGSNANPYRYRGLLNLGYDDVSGALLAMGAREYSSQLGTFTQQDSVAGSAANPATMNRFLYALANPATLIDPDGHRALLDEGPYLVPVDMQTKEPIYPKVAPVVKEPHGVAPLEGPAVDDPFKDWVAQGDDKEPYITIFVGMTKPDLKVFNGARQSALAYLRALYGGDVQFDSALVRRVHDDHMQGEDGDQDDFEGLKQAFIAEYEEELAHKKAEEEATKQEEADQQSEFYFDDGFGVPGVNGVDPWSPTMPKFEFPMFRFPVFEFFFV